MLADLLKEAADYLSHVAANWDTAEALLRRAWALEVDGLETCPVRVSATLHALGSVGRMRGDLVSARLNLQSGLELRLRVGGVGEGGERLAQSMQELALRELRQVAASADGGDASIPSATPPCTLLRR
jgi:hypothetical protein